MNGTKTYFPIEGIMHNPFIFRFFDENNCPHELSVYVDIKENPLIKDSLYKTNINEQCDTDLKICIKDYIDSSSKVSLLYWVKLWSESLKCRGKVDGLIRNVELDCINLSGEIEKRLYFYNAYIYMAYFDCEPFDYNKLIIKYDDVTLTKYGSTD